MAFRSYLWDSGLRRRRGDGHSAARHGLARADPRPLLDRGMMGDGVIDLRGIRSMIQKAGFFGPQEVEIFSSENWWKRPGQDLSASFERYRTVAECPQSPRSGNR